MISCWPSTDGVCVKIRSSRAAAVCLALLCVLLLTAVIVLCVMFISKNENLTNEKNDLQMSLGNIKGKFLHWYLYVRYNSAKYIFM